MDQGKQSSPAWSSLTHTVTSVLLRDGMTAASAVYYDVRPHAYAHDSSRAQAASAATAACKRQGQKPLRCSLASGCGAIICMLHVAAAHSPSSKVTDCSE